MSNKLETLHNVGDVVLIKDLEKDKLYRMYHDQAVVDDFVKGCMTSNKVVTITEVVFDKAVEVDEVDGYKYKIDKPNVEGSNVTYPFSYTDEMFVGKLIPVDDFKELKFGDLILLTDEEDRDVDDQFLGKVAKFNYYSEFANEVNIEIDGVKYLAYARDVVGVFYNPVEFYRGLIQGQDEVCDCDFLNEEDLKQIENQNKNEIGDDVEMVTVATVAEMVAKAAVLHEGEKVVVAEKPKLEKIKPHVLVPEDIGLNGIISYNIKVDRVISSEPAVIMLYRTGAYDENGQFYIPKDSKQKKVVAKAQHGDVFDTQKGMEVCTYKMFNRESAKRVKQLSK